MINRNMVRILALLLVSPSLHANIYTVSTAADSGAGSLRQAILDANAQGVPGAPHTINFAIPGSGPHTISPLSPLPNVLISTQIYGYSQPGSVQNTAPQGSNAVLKIELDGSQAGAADGLYFTKAAAGASGGGSYVFGLVINRFQGAGIRVDTPCLLPGLCEIGNVLIHGNFIGTDVTGNVALGNGTGIIFGPNSLLEYVGDQVQVDGGPSNPIEAHRNLISGNTLDGIYLYSIAGRGPSTQHTIRGNIIGLNAAGTAALGNGRYGIFADNGSEGLRVEDNLISANASDGVRIMAGNRPAGLARNGIGMGTGGTTFGNAGNGVYVGGLSTTTFVGGRYSANVGGEASIRGNGGAGVFIADTALVDATNIWTAANTGLGVDIAPLGVNPNDDTDPDAGPNEGLNYPQLFSVNRDPLTSEGTVIGQLNSNPGITVQISLYYSDRCDATGYGEGQALFMSVLANLTPDASGIARFSANAPFLPVGKFMTTQSRRFASNPPTASGAGITSEYSNCVPVTTYSSLLFANGFE
jgi:hypothetical protein